MPHLVSVELENKIRKFQYEKSIIIQVISQILDGNYLCKAGQTMESVFFTNRKIIKYQSLDMNLFKLNESNCGLKNVYKARSVVKK